MEFQDGGEDEADVDMKAHGSVLSHLLSQVRIGMDLTKVITRHYSIKYLLKILREIFFLKF